MKLPENYPCTVSIGFPSGNGGRFTEITIEDTVSGCYIASVRMSMAEFANAISSLACRPAVLQRVAVRSIGKKRELKEEEVFVPSGDYKNRENIGRKAVAPFEVDGWECHNVSDTSNHHRWTNKEPPKGKKGNWHRVTFFRFVDATPDDLDAAREKNTERAS